MERVLVNLILNALEAMNNNGKLIIESSSKGESIYLSFKDDGCGINKDFIEKKLFKPFNSTKDKGMGIGLYQCKTIVEAHGGSIEAESEEGKGTTFKVKMSASGIGRRVSGVESRVLGV